MAIPGVGAAGAAPARVVLVSVDGLPAGIESWRASVPALGTLAVTSLRADSAAAPGTPFAAWAELLTGSTAGRTGVWDESAPGPAPRSPSLAGTLGSLGYHGLGLPGDPVAHAGSGLERGFERFDPASPAWAESARVDSALAWLAAPGRRFAWLGLSLGAPGELWRRADGIGPADAAGFAQRLAAADVSLARLFAGLDRAGLRASTLVAVVGAGVRPHGPQRVPVLLWGPGIAPGPVPGGLRLADVSATLAAATGAPTSAFEGISLLAPASAAARAKRWRGAARAQHDSLALPAEVRAEAQRLFERAARPDSALLAGWDSLCSRHPGSARLELERAVARSRAGQEAIAARTLKDMATASPGDARVALAYAEHLLRHDRGSIAADVLGRIAPRCGFAAAAAWRLTLAYAGAGDFIAAEGAADRAARLALPNAEARAASSQLHALAMLRDSSARAPRDAHLRVRFGRALGEFGLFASAYREFHAARALASTSPEPDFWLATFLMREGRPQHAEPGLQRALGRDSTYAPARHLLAEALLEQGKRGAAASELEWLAARGGLGPREWYNLACLRAGGGDAPGALAALVRAVAEGYDDWNGIATDPDLEALRSDPRFPQAPR